MPDAARQGDTTLCWVDIGGVLTTVTKNIAQGSNKVTTDGKPQAYLGHLTTHPCNIASGSNKVSIQGHPAARTGDSVSCGGHITSGSSKVTIN
jgi:uncharacterized Zn-binding protein involved in type VI secretion